MAKRYHGVRNGGVLAKVYTRAGWDGEQVEVDIASGLPRFNVAGLPDAAVQEARERVRAAVRNSSFTLPMKWITVSLALRDTHRCLLRT